VTESILEKYQALQKKFSCLILPASISARVNDEDKNGDADRSIFLFSFPDIPIKIVLSRKTEK